MQSTAISKKNNHKKLLAVLKAITLLGLLFSIPFSNLQAQNDSHSPVPFFKIKLKDRSNFIGELLKESKDSLIFRMPTDEVVRLHRSDIKYYYKVQPGKIHKGKYRPDLFDYDKGFINPQAFGPKKGAVYFETSMLLWNELNVGLNDYLSLRVGFDSYGIAQRLFDNYYNQYYEPLILITPKFSFPIIKNKWHLAISPAIINIPENDGFLDYGLLFLSNSFGNKNNNFTIGIGTRLFGDGRVWGDVYFAASANIRITNRIAIITENWAIPTSEDDNYDRYQVDTYLLNSLGIEVLGQHLNWSITIVRFNPWGDDNFNYFPVAGIALPISRGGAWKS